MTTDVDLLLRGYYPGVSAVVALGASAAVPTDSVLPGLDPIPLQRVPRQG